MRIMSTIAELRLGRRPHVLLFAAVAAFLPITLVSWIAWRVIEGDGSTLLTSQFPQWLLVTLGGAVVTCVANGVFWRTPSAYAGVVLGVLSAVLAVLAGLFIDLVGSGGLA